MKKILYIFVLGLAIFVIHACEIINPEEKIPAYIKIDNIVVNEDNSEVVDAWVYIDNNLQGVYELPALFPVLNIGEKEILIKPGIKLNGISVSRDNYPYYKDWKTTATLTSGETLEVFPQTSLKENLTYLWSETFETVAITMEPYDSTMVNFHKVDTMIVAPSEHVGVIPLLSDSIFQVQTINYYFLPLDRDVYLEMSYKCDYYFELAWLATNLIDGQTSEARIYQFNPTANWQHIYFRLTDFITDYPLTTKFQFLFGSRNNTDKTTYFYFDNIRLIHY